MPAKSATSTYSIGAAMIRSDKPTVAKLKAAADAKGLTLVEYMRYLADNAEPGQPALTGIGGGKPQSDTTKLTRVCAALLVMASPASWLEEFKTPGSMMKFIERGEIDLDALQESAFAAIKFKAASVKVPQPHLPELDTKEVAPT